MRLPGSRDPNKEQSSSDVLDNTISNPSEEYGLVATLGASRAATPEANPVDYKSIVRRAYDAIDSTARRIPIAPAFTKDLTEDPHSDFFDVEENSSGKESEMVLTPAAARAKAKAASAYAASSSKENQNHSHKKRVTLRPGAEYVNARAPGLSPAFYLRLLRINNSRQASESGQLQAAQRQAHRGSFETTSSTTNSFEEISAIPAQCSSLTTFHSRESKKCSRCTAPATKVCCIAVLVAVVLLSIGCGVGIALSSKGKGQSGTNEVVGSLGHTRFGPYTADCSVLHGQEQPNIWSQCHCHGNISIVANDISERYFNLTNTFIHTILPDFNESSNSCRPENLALMWLASGDGLPTEPTAAITQSRMLQRYKFVLLFTLWNGPAWIFKNKWLSSSNECSWLGLICNSHGVVTNITLTQNNVTVDLVSTAIHLEDLLSLQVEYNTMLGNSIPTEVGFLSNLKSLSLHSSRIKGTLPTQLFDLRELEEISVSFNSISGSVPSFIGKLEQLREFYLEHNAFTGSIPTEIGQCTKLGSFVLSQNHMNGTLPSEMGSLSALEYVYARTNYFTGTMPSQLGHCLNLTELDVSNNNIEGTVPTEFESLPQLGYLNVAGNQLQVPQPICELLAESHKSCIGCRCLGNV